MITYHGGEADIFIFYSQMERRTKQTPIYKTLYYNTISHLMW